MEEKSISRHVGTLAILVAAAVTLAACNSQKKEAGPPILNGKWASTDGVYTANFANGAFQATANDTGSLISKGSYIVIGTDTVRINWTSEVTGNANQADCKRTNANLLDCADLAGARFSLRRS